jgi:hypothetical protein
MSTEAHLLRYTRMAGADGVTPRDVFLLITSTEATLATLEAASAMIFDGGFEPERVLWLPMERNATIPLAKRTDGWYTTDGVTAVLIEGNP